MTNIQRLAIVVAAAVGAAMFPLAIPAANADTGACASYLEEKGLDTTLRYHVCVETEFLGDTVSQEFALQACDALLALTSLPTRESQEACQIALRP